MVSYPEWTGIVHEAYKSMGGDYGTSGRSVSQAVTRAAAEFWQRNKAQIKALAVDAARELARQLIMEYADQRGGFP